MHLLLYPILSFLLKPGYRIQFQTHFSNSQDTIFSGKIETQTLITTIEEEVF